MKPPGRTLYYEHGWHLLLRDLQAQTVWRDCEAFIRDPGGAMPSGAPRYRSGSPRGRTSRTFPRAWRLTARST
ncbi:MAG: hypothetical protein WDN45_04775 [Caulobacteraceae bacterium]